MHQNDHATRGHAASPTSSKRPRISSPLERLAHEHELQLELCEALEHIADGLPGRIDMKLVRAVIGVLEHGMTGHFAFEEDVLFPLLRSRAPGDTSLAAALNQLESEHVRDGDLCHELADELKVLCAHGEPRNANMLAYMLRGFFEGQRRHLEWENSIVLPAAARHLTTEDLEGLSRHAERPSRNLPTLKILQRDVKRPRRQ